MKQSPFGISSVLTWAELPEPRSDLQGRGLPRPQLPGIAPAEALWSEARLPQFVILAPVLEAVLAEAPKHCVFQFQSLKQG